jgi:hypothetical protein
MGLCLALYMKLSICCCCLFVLPDHWSGLRCPAVHRRPNVDPSEDEVAVVCPPDHNSDARGQVLFLTGQHRRFLWALSPLWLPYPPRQFLQDSCPGRLPRLCHLPSQTTHHPIHGWPHRLPTSSQEVRAGAVGTHGAPRAALSQEVGARAAGTCGTPRAALRREAGAGAQATRGAPGAALSQEVGAGATGYVVPP